VIVAIMTDGMENSSREWTHPAIKALVEQQTTTYGWQFLYMGADQDAIEVGASLGVHADHSVTFARGKAGAAMAVKSQKIREWREARETDPAAPMPAFTEQERTRLAE
jgi:formylmethanofuran dehydrogenase subunit B